MRTFQPICLWCDAGLLLTEEVSAGVCMRCWRQGADDGHPPSGFTPEQWWKLRELKKKLATKEA